MIVNDPTVIQELVACSPRELSLVAKKHGLADSMALVVRNHWVRRITSRCVKCNILVQGDACLHCQTTRQPATKLLQEIKPRDVALRRYCIQCGIPFFYSAGYILSAFKKKKAFKPSSTCDGCRTSESPVMGPKRKKKATKGKLIKAKTTKKPAAKPLAPKQPKWSEALIHQPFAALSTLKVKN